MEEKILTSTIIIIIIIIITIIIIIVNIIYRRLNAPSTAQGHLRVFHKFKSYTSHIIEKAFKVLERKIWGVKSSLQIVLKIAYGAMLKLNNEKTVHTPLL